MHFIEFVERFYCDKTSDTGVFCVPKLRLYQGSWIYDFFPAIIMLLQHIFVLF